MRLYKSTMTIWTTYDPTEIEPTELVHPAENVGAYCSSMTFALIPELEKDPAWDGTEFFDDEDDDQCVGPDNAGPEPESSGPQT